MDNQFFRQNEASCNKQLTRAKGAPKEVALSYDEQLAGDKVLGDIGAHVIKNGYNDFFKLNEASKCGVLRCSVMKVGCKEKLVSDKITLDIRSPFNFHAKTAGSKTKKNDTCTAAEASLPMNEVSAGCKRRKMRDKEREEGYTVELCYQCTNGFDTESVDNFRVVVQGDECLKEDTLTNTTNTDTGELLKL
jgi:hypothetical protein